MRGAEKHGKCLSLARGRDGDALGGGSVLADGEEFPQDCGLRTTLDAGGGAGPIQEICYSEGEVRVRYASRRPNLQLSAGHPRILTRRSSQSKSPHFNPRVSLTR